jgi:hypothetical protein
MNKTLKTIYWTGLKTRHAPAICLAFARGKIKLTAKNLHLYFGQSQAAPRTPLESPNFAGRSAVTT